MRPEHTKPTIVGVIPMQATAVMQKETCIKKYFNGKLYKKTSWPKT